MCGEHTEHSPLIMTYTGSSPHVRGALHPAQERVLFGGIIPACAGSTPHLAGCGMRRRDHPRMCGEHLVKPAPHVLNSGSSPHVRGAPVVICIPETENGIIPACAGSTGSSPASTSSTRDHPRMCGEHSINPDHYRNGPGSSPHVRGAHFENSIIPRKRKDNWLFFIQFRFENFLAFRYLLALLHPFLGVPTKDPSFASLGRLINCNPSQSTGDQSAPYTLKAICCSFLAE